MRHAQGPAHWVCACQGTFLNTRAGDRTNPLAESPVVSCNPPRGTVPNRPRRKSAGVVRLAIRISISPFSARFVSHTTPVVPDLGVFRLLQLLGDLFELSCGVGGRRREQDSDRVPGEVELERRGLAALASELVHCIEDLPGDGRSVAVVECVPVSAFRFQERERKRQDVGALAQLGDVSPIIAGAPFCVGVEYRSECRESDLSSNKEAP